jgi:hypothetical protein
MNEMAPLKKSGVVDEAVMYGVQRQFEPVRNSQLVENIVEVVFDCLFANEELFPDLFIPVTLCDQLHDFFFAIAE